MKVPTALFLSLFMSIFAVNGPAHEKNELTVMKSMHGHSDKIRVLKRQLNCPVDEYHSSVHCCKLCPAGKYKSKDCSEEHGLPECTPCQEGLYMAIANHDAECHRCSLCDPGEGFEVDQNCTGEKNTICQCMEHYFCSASSPCIHCEPCDKCNNGYVKEECTRRKNTVCQDNNRLPDYAIALIALIALGIPAAVAGYCWHRKRRTRALDQPSPEEQVHLQEGIPLEAYPPAVECPAPTQYWRLVSSDVDLEPHFTDIANETKIEEMLLFVRKNGMSEPIIEQIQQDSRQNSHEQKIQLLGKWYQSHGQRGAFAKLIKTFEENGLHVRAKKLFEKINSSASSRIGSNSICPDEQHNI